MKITSDTSICCSVAHPKQALTISLHNVVSEHLGLDIAFFAIDTQDLKGTVAGMRALGLRFLSVGDPYKTKIIEYIDEVDKHATFLRRVNSVVNHQGILTGHNSDWIGAVLALKEKTTLTNKSALVIGSGNAAKAIAYGLRQEGALPTLISQDEQKAHALAAELGVKHHPFASRNDVEEFDLVVNATPLGMATHAAELPFNLQTLREDTVVFDVVFNPPLTALGRNCRERGNPFVSGVRWLVHRVAYQIYLYARRDAPLDVLENALLDTIPRFFPNI